MVPGAVSAGTTEAPERQEEERVPAGWLLTGATTTPALPVPELALAQSQPIRDQVDRQNACP